MKGVAVMSAAVLALVAAGCRSSESVATADVHRVERIEARVADTFAVSRALELERPVITVEYADSPDRRVTISGRRLSARASAEAARAVEVAEADSLAGGVEEAESAASVPTQSRAVWIAIAAAFVAGVLVGCRCRR